MEKNNEKQSETNEELVPGDVINDFEIIGELGRGANGIVYRARQIQMDREVALKILPATKAAEPGFVENFLREARLAARIHHPSIVMVIDAGISDAGIYFIAMELIDGDTMEDIVFQSGPIEYHKALKMAQDIADGLDYAWRTEQLTHGDIKPANIMINAAGNAKLADLGLAKLAGESHNGELMATPLFAPPEVCLFDFKKIGFKSDMYSYACTLFFMFSGEAPFEEEDTDKVLQMHISEKPPELIERLPFLPREISDFIGKMLAKNPDDRPENWGEVADFLKHSRTVLEEQELLAQKTKKRKMLMRGAAVLLLVVIISLLWMLFSGISGMKTSSPKVSKKTVSEKVVQSPPSEIAVETPTQPETQEAVSEPDKENQPPAKAVEDEKQKQINALLLSFENQYRNIVGDANFQAKPCHQLMKIEKQLTDLRFNLESGSFPKELKTSSFKEMLDADLKLLPGLISEEQVQEEKKRLESAIDGFSVKSSLLPDSLFSEQAAATINYFWTLSTLLKQISLTQSKEMPERVLNDAMLQKQLPENREQLEFLKNHLLNNTGPKDIMLAHHKKFIGCKLPWTGRDGFQWSIAGIEPDVLNLSRSADGGGVANLRWPWAAITDVQYSLLLEKSIFPLVKKELSSAECGALAGWLLRKDFLEILKDFIASPGQMGETELRRWQRFLAESATINNELDAIQHLCSIQQLLRERNYHAAMEKLFHFTGDKFSGAVFTELKPEMEKLVENLLWHYPEAQGQFLTRALIKSGTDAPGAISRCATILARYYAFGSYAEELLLQDYRKRVLAAKSSVLNDNFELPPNQPLKPGMFYKWISAQGYVDGRDSVMMLSSALDIGNWELIAEKFKPEFDTGELGKIDGKILRLKNAILYDRGFIAFQFGNLDTAPLILETMSRDLPLRADGNSVAAVRLAMATRNYQRAESIIRNLRPEDNSLAAYQLLVAKLLIQIQNADFSENDFAREVSVLKMRFKNLDFISDFNILDFAADLYQGNNAMPTRNDFKKCHEPALLARLCLDVVARDVLIGRRTVDVGAVIETIDIVDSAYFSDIWYRRALLLLLKDGPLISQWRKNVELALNDFSMAALPNYPEMLILKCFVQIMGDEFTLSDTVQRYDHIMKRLPMASEAKRNFAAALSEPEKFSGNSDYWLLLSSAFSLGMKPDSDLDAIFDNVRKLYPTPLQQELLLERDLKTMLKALHSIKKTAK